MIAHELRKNRARRAGLHDDALSDSSHGIGSANDVGLLVAWQPLSTTWKRTEGNGNRMSCACTSAGSSAPGPCTWLSANSAPPSASTLRLEQQPQLGSSTGPGQPGRVLGSRHACAMTPSLPFAINGSGRFRSSAHHNCRNGAGASCAPTDKLADQCPGSGCSRPLPVTTRLVPRSDDCGLRCIALSVRCGSFAHVMGSRDWQDDADWADCRFVVDRLLVPGLNWTARRSWRIAAVHRLMLECSCQ